MALKCRFFAVFWHVLRRKIWLTPTGGRERGRCRRRDEDSGRLGGGDGGYEKVDMAGARGTGARGANHGCGSRLAADCAAAANAGCVLGRDHVHDRDAIRAGRGVDHIEAAAGRDRDWRGDGRGAGNIRGEPNILCLARACCACGVICALVGITPKLLSLCGDHVGDRPADYARGGAVDDRRSPVH